MRKHPLIRAVLFDWDGTLLDSYHADVGTFLQMFRALGVDWGVAELERHYVPDWYQMYRAAGIPRERWEEANRMWRRYYRQQKPRLMPGARRVLRALGRSFALALVTTGDRTRVRRQLRRFGLSGVFAARVCGEDAHPRKPHPAPLRAALRRLRLPPDVCVYVGDAPQDIEMARHTGLRAIAVLGRFSTPRRLRAARPDALLESITDLPRLLKTDFGSR